jgi:thiol-disulfide isomerase/thioredoxin
MMASQQAKAVSALLLTLKQRTQSLTSLLVKMDLGFGNANQVLGEVAAKALLQSSKAQEVALDAEMQRYDALLEDEDALEQLRARRLVQLKNTQKQRQQWKEQGHGVYSSLLEGQGDVAKAFFEATKQSQRVVIHFYRPTTASCDIFHLHLQALARQHLETRFIKINVEGCEKGTNGASFLVEKLGIVILPTLVLIRDRKAVHHLHGFDELGGTDSFATNTLAYVLGKHGVVTPRDDEVPPYEDITGGSVNAIRILKAGVRDGFHNDDYDNEE